MAVRTIIKGTDLSSIFQSNRTSIFSYLASNPGSLSSEIASGTSKTQELVDVVIGIASNVGFVVIGTTFGGVPRYWRSQEWVDRLNTYVTDAEGWAEDAGFSAGGELESELQSVLITAGLASNESEPITKSFIEVLKLQGYVEVV
jgi:hypothetical protein